MRLEVLKPPAPGISHRRLSAGGVDTGWVSPRERVAQRARKLGAGRKAYPPPGLLAGQPLKRRGDHRFAAGQVLVDFERAHRARDTIGFEWGETDIEATHIGRNFRLRLSA